MLGGKHITIPRVPPHLRAEGSEVINPASLPEPNVVAGHDRLTVAKPQHNFRDQLSDQASARVVFIGVGGGCVARFIHFPFHAQEIARG